MAKVSTDERGFPPGPWVLVIGMHRSGTSAVTGALGQLGLRVPAAGDLVAGWPDNPVHFESHALTEVDDAILRGAGGSWSSPPDFEEHWQRSPAVVAALASARAAAWRAFPDGGPLAWKDPRLSLLLPLWRSLLPSPVITVYVWREPLAVARSLQARQSFTISHGLALWERYTRASLGALAGHDVFVVRYEDLLEDPAVLLRSVAGWLHDAGGLPQAPTDDAISAAISSVAVPLARQRHDGEIPDVLRVAVAELSTMGGAHDVLRSVELPAAPSWMGDAIRQRRHYETLYARYLRYAKWRRKIPFVGASPRRARKLGTPDDT